MKTKDILIISQTFYPEIAPRSFRTTELAKELARQGHQVTVLLPGNMDSAEIQKWSNEYGVQFQFYGPLTWKYFGKTRLFGDWSRKFGRLVELLFEYPRIEIYFKLPKHLKQLGKTYDILISIASPHENHWAVAKIHSKRKLARTWIADCGDPFAGNTLETIKPPFYLRWLENHFLKYADFVTVPVAGAIVAFDAAYRDKFRVIPQGFDFSVSGMAVHTADSDVIRMGYAGGISFSGIRSPFKLIQYLLSCKDIRFEFHIYSPGVGMLEEVAQISDGRLILHNVIPRSMLVPKLSQLDFLINFDNGVSTAIPSKLIDYGLTGRPILNISASNPDTKLIDAFLVGDYSKQYVIADIEQYNIKNVAARFLALGN